MSAVDEMERLVPGLKRGMPINDAELVIIQFILSVLKEMREIREDITRIVGK